MSLDLLHQDPTSPQPPPEDSCGIIDDVSESLVALLVLSFTTLFTWRPGLQA